MKRDLMAVNLVRLMSVVLVVLGVFYTLDFDLLGIVLLLCGLFLRVLLTVRLLMDRVERLEDYLNMTDD